ncbi:hypothetical protein D9753_06535 [Streptomyces dangxiongensis]|uniref:Uncharacterized protein n=1 Tax=Streptomyces dangxiongensis TaxID=1442032 RepID=A0A3G2JD05_9ACTN|nr:hypothetical protein [Streptomyces dangxiongensis]AYN38629.1 hypothetical protein D9753_06535 [Streptomyces dangxiongensis]
MPATEFLDTMGIGFPGHLSADEFPPQAREGTIEEKRPRSFVLAEFQAQKAVYTDYGRAPGIRTRCPAGCSPSHTN